MPAPDHLGKADPGPAQSSCQWMEADFHVLSPLLETLFTENFFVKVSKNKELLH